MEDELQKRNTDCVYFLASPLTCKKVRPVKNTNFCHLFFFFPSPFSLFDLLLVFFSVSNAAICFLFSNFSFGICSCNQSFEGCRSLGFVSDLGFCYE